jgi:hypothetical protein
MKCTGQELYNALTQREMIQLFTGMRLNKYRISTGAINVRNFLYADHFL